MTATLIKNNRGEIMDGCPTPAREPLGTRQSNRSSVGIPMT